MCTLVENTTDHTEPQTTMADHKADDDLRNINLDDNDDGKDNKEDKEEDGEGGRCISLTNNIDV